MEEKRPENIPYIAFESELARQERHFMRLWAVIILLIVLLVGSNVGWLIYESQFEDISVTQDIDTGEGDAMVAGVGDVNYGESQTDNQSSSKENWR